MSASYTPVAWTRSKLVYDAAAVAAVVVYLSIYFALGAKPGPEGIAPDGPTLAMNAFGSCAFLLLTVVLSIGPLTRLDRRFLPLLYNRRHLGVLTCTVAACHASSVLNWYFAYSDFPPVQALLVADTSLGQLSGFAFVAFGVAAFLILLVLAATSHDFWLAFLGAPVWKAMHMAIYAAYLLVIGHIALGAMQDARSLTLATVCTLSAMFLVALHLIAGLRATDGDRRQAADGPATPWVVGAPIDKIVEGRGIVVAVPNGQPVAIFRHDGRLSAVSNVCAHQNGPLGEGRVIDGCITCPWHGFQYRLEDGCAPPPFTERIATYTLKLDGATVLLDPRPNPPGTRVVPLELPEHV